MWCYICGGEHWPEDCPMFAKHTSEPPYCAECLRLVDEEHPHADNCSKAEPLQPKLGNLEKWGFDS